MKTQPFFPLLLLVSIGLLAIGCGRQQPPDAVSTPSLESLHRALDVFNDAYARADVPALDEMLTMGYLHTNGANPALDKERWLQYVASRRKAIDAGELVIDSYGLLDAQVRLYEGAAAVAGKVRVNGLNEDGPFESVFRVTQLWIFEGGGWKRAAFHDGRVR